MIYFQAYLRQIQNKNTETQYFVEIFHVYKPTNPGNKTPDCCLTSTSSVTDILPLRYWELVMHEASENDF